MLDKVNIDGIPMFEFTLNPDCTVQEYHPLLQNLPNFVGSGSFGVTLGDGKHCVKLANQIYGRELGYALWASEKKVGPKLLCHGFMVIPPSIIKRLKQSANAAGTPIPRWLKELNDNGPSAQLAFIAFEQWPMTLYHVLIEQKLTLDLIMPIVSIYKEKLDVLRRHKVVHGDLMPRNILVKMEDGKLSDLCFTDFADAFKWKYWFTEEVTSERFRYQSLHIYYNFNLNARLKVAIQSLLKESLPNSTLTGQEALHRWMLYQPHNLDACVLACLVHTLEAPELFPIALPPSFNFKLGWNSDCMMKVAVQHMNFKQEFIVHGLKPLSYLRRALNQYGSERFVKLHFLLGDGKQIPREKEHKYFPSTSIVADPTILFRYCIHMAEAKEDIEIKP